MISQFETYRKELLKKGMAEVVIEFAAAPNDTKFKDSPPTCRVRLKAFDRANDNKVIFSTWKELTSRMTEQQRKFQIPVITFMGVVERIFSSKPKPQIVITVEASPINGWEDVYEGYSKEFDDMLPGGDYSVAVTLKRQEGQNRRPTTAPLRPRDIGDR